LAFIIEAMKVNVNRKMAVIIRIEAVNRLRQYRFDEKLSVIELQKRLVAGGFEISRQSLYDWEEGKYIPSMKKIEEIQEALGREFV